MLGDMEPFRMIGNLYFVGTKAASSHIIDTGDGLIMIDTGYAKTADVIVESMQTLGFDMADVKYILHSHGHGDHTGGTSKLLPLCHAETWLHKNDLMYITDFTPDHSYEDGDVIRLGNTEIRVLFTPGHTLGTVSFFFDVTEDGQKYRCAMFGGAGVKQMGKDYVARPGLTYDQRRQFFASIERLKQEKVDVLVGNHTWQNHYPENYEKMKSSEVNPFIGADRWGKFLEKSKLGLEKLIREEAKTKFINYAHRGASEYCPENTFLSFYTGMYMHANGIETDVRRTKDGKLVLFHDKNLERVSDCDITVEDSTYEELFAHKITKNGLSDNIVLFEDFLSHFADSGLEFAIELKADDIEEEIAKLIGKYGLLKKATVTSFGFERLCNMKKIAPKINLGYLVKGEITDEILDTCRQNGIDEICPQASIVDYENVDKWHMSGFRVRAWGVTDTELMKKAYDANVDGMTCNFPDMLDTYICESKQ